MSVRQRRRKRPDGTTTTTWMVHIKQQQPEGCVVEVRRKAPVQSRRAAEQFERQVRQSILDGSYGKQEEVETPTFQEYARDFLRIYAEAHNKPSEVANKRAVIANHLVPALGERRLRDIGRKEIEQLKANMLNAGLVPKTINNYLSILHKMLAEAAEWGHIDNAPRMRWLRRKEPDLRFYGFDEAERLIQAAEPGWKAMIVLGLKAGLRLGELRALRWDDVDLMNGSLVVRRAAWKDKIGTPKSGRSRRLPLGETALSALKQQKLLVGGKSVLVFPGETGGLLTKGECKWPLKRACKAAGVENLGWHALRHTFASHLVMRGADVRCVQELMGHTDIRVTMRYLHLCPDSQQEAVKLLDGKPGAPQEHPQADSKKAEANQ